MYSTMNETLSLLVINAHAHFTARGAPFASWLSNVRCKI